MRIAATIARNLLGFAFVLFGLNYFLEFLPAQDPPPADAAAFLGALVAGKVLGLAKILEIAAGLALLANRAVPLALVVLAPIIVAINLFHVVYAPATLALPLILAALALVVAWRHREAFAPLFRVP